MKEILPQVIDTEHLAAKTRQFGKLLGEIVQEQEGEAVYQAVEKLRIGFISLRQQEEPELRKELMEYIKQLDLEPLEKVIRAFNVFYLLSNIIEEDFTHRQRRQQFGSADKLLWKGSVRNTVLELQEAGINATDMQRLVDHLSYAPVFTAHPTEARRRTMMDIQRRLFMLIDAIDEPDLSDEKLASLNRQLKSQIQLLWPAIQSHPLLNPPII